MSLINSILKVFVGDKYKKDLKLLQPIVAEVNKFETEISNLTNDQLRDKTNYFKQKIKEITQPFTSQIELLKEETLKANIDRKEEIYTEIDQLEQNSYEST